MGFTMSSDSLLCSEKVNDVFANRRSTALVLPSADLKILHAAQNLSGCFIAGGAALAIYNGEFKFLKDWDLFFSSFGSYNRAYNKFLDMGYKEVSHSNFGKMLELKSYGDGKSSKVNLIDWFFPNKVEEIFNSFDFSVCCFAIVGDTLFYTKQAKKDEKDKLLNIVHLKKENIVLTFKRIARYGIKGYVPSNEFVLKFEEFFKERKISKSDLTLYVAQGGCGS